jgi:hypothetical protein
MSCLPSLLHIYRSYLHWFDKLGRVDGCVARRVGVEAGYLVRQRQVRTWLGGTLKQNVSDNAMVCLTLEPMHVCTWCVSGR